MASTGTSRSTRGMHGPRPLTLSSDGNRLQADPWDSPRGLRISGRPVMARAVGCDADAHADSVDANQHSGVAQNGRAPENGLRGPRKGHQEICYPGGVGSRGVEWRTGCGCTVTCPKRDLAKIATSGKRVVLKSSLLSVMRVRAPSPLPSLSGSCMPSPQSMGGSAATIVDPRPVGSVWAADRPSPVIVSRRPMAGPETLALAIQVRVLAGK